MVYKKKYSNFFGYVVMLSIVIDFLRRIAWFIFKRWKLSRATKKLREHLQEARELTSFSMPKVDIEFSYEGDILKVVSKQGVWLERAPRTTIEYEELLSRYFIRCGLIKMQKFRRKLTDNLFHALVHFYAYRFADDSIHWLSAHKLYSELKSAYSKYETKLSELHAEGLLIFLEDTLSSMEEDANLPKSIEEFLNWLIEVNHERLSSKLPKEIKIFDSPPLPKCILIFISSLDDPMDKARKVLEHIDKSSVKKVLLAAYHYLPVVNQLRTIGLIKRLALKGNIKMSITGFYIIPDYPTKGHIALRTILSVDSEEEIIENGKIEFNPEKGEPSIQTIIQKVNEGNTVTMSCNLDKHGYDLLQHISRVLARVPVILRARVSSEENQLIVNIRASEDKF